MMDADGLCNAGNRIKKGGKYYAAAHDNHVDVGKCRLAAAEYRRS
jgi:hypothetical protein